MTTNALAVAESAAPAIATGLPSFAQPKSLAEIRAIGETLVASGFFKDVKSVAQACTKMIAGMALGYDAVTSMNAFHIIEGKITLTAGEVGARIKRSGKYNYRVTQLDDTGATVVFMERDGDKWMDIGTSVFTKTDAATAGLANKQVWKSYFRNMAFSRSLTNGARWFCPDVFGGPVYTPEELGADVTIIDGEIVVLGEGETLKPPTESKKPPSGAEIKSMYARARKLYPELPEDIKTWATGRIDGYDPAKNPTGKMVAQMAAILEPMLAEGAKAQAETAQEDGETIPEAQITEPQPPSPQATATRFPPAHNGTGITPKTRAHIFAILRELNVGVPIDSTQEAKEESRRDRIAYANEFGLKIKSFNDLSDEQGEWLAIRLDEYLHCVACQAEIGKGAKHKPECPEAM